MCGSGSMAKVPKRPGWSVSSFLAYSFDSRAMRAACALSVMNLTCGVVGEVIAVATPPLSMSSSVFCTDQLAIGGLARLAVFTASSQVGGEMW